MIIKSLLVSLYEVAVLVLLVSATNLDITAGLLGKEKVFETFNDFHLFGHVMSTLKTTDEFDCGLHCLRNHHCRSYNSKPVNERREEIICELSNQTRQTRPDNFRQSPGFTYFGKAVKGWHSNHPGHSCKDILKSRDSLGDGEYWINPEGNGNSMKVYCDMTTAGGGWLLVFNVVVEDSKPLPTIAAQDSYRKIDNFRSNPLFLTNNALNELRKFLAFTQMRFHCHKPGKRTFHVATIINSTGEAVIQFFTGQTTQKPESCGSFIPLPDDNSILAGECAKWGRENWKFHVGKCSHQGRKELRDHLAMIGDRAHWNIVPPRWECDDYVHPSNPAPPAGSFWKIYVR
ncbi:uncharacterized protein [Montipora foliosa]|uniref:uncharacterized protein isoform X1 n=1 Tax=Montipora foliosa TaxID=591990 RepID=UPI0035F15329